MEIPIKYCSSLTEKDETVITSAAVIWYKISMDNPNEDIFLPTNSDLWAFEFTNQLVRLFGT